MSRRAKRDGRELDAEHAKLTVRQRLALALSSELSVDDWRAITGAYRDGAKRGDEKAGAMLARLITHAFGSQPMPEEPDPDPATSMEDMTPAQRAALRAVLLQRVEQEAREAEQQARAAMDPSDPRLAEPPIWK